ncbi:MAG: peptide ABC transporter substrate-binding protein [Simkaniaceae bacterium]|nr:peptide ABC transporter substrate-binding protein [Simkaniaceae bacterium]
MKILALLAMLLSIQGCIKKKVVPQQKLNVSFTNPIRTLNPSYAGELPACYVVSMLFEGLTRVDEKGNIALAVAEKYTVSEDSKTYTFMLRDTFWSDGTPVTAYDFEYAWKKCIDPKTGSRGAQLFYIIKNAKLVTQRQAPMSQVGLKALDPYTLEIKLEYPIPYLLDLLGRVVYFYPIPKHLDKTDPSWIHRTDQTFVSNGPFKLKKWKQQEELIVEKTPSYWDQQHVSLPEISISFIGDERTQLYLYEKDQLDWIGAPLNNIPQQALKTLQQQVGHSRLDAGGFNCFLLNNKAFPFRNKKMRQAFSYALDRHAIVDHILGGNAIPAYGVVSPFFALGNSACFEDRKFDEAKRLFNEALTEEGLNLKTFPGLTIRYATGSEVFFQIVQIVQQVWEQTFGIKVTLSPSDFSTHINAVQKGDYQIGAIGCDFTIDPIYILQTYKYSDDVMNLSNWEAQEYIDLLEASNYETDFEKRKALLIAAEKFLMDAMPIIPLYYRAMEFSKKPRLTGVVFSNGDVDFKFARLSH